MTSTNNSINAILGSNLVCLVPEFNKFLDKLQNNAMNCLSFGDDMNVESFETNMAKIFDESKKFENAVCFEQMESAKLQEKKENQAVVENLLFLL